MASRSFAASATMSTTGGGYDVECSMEQALVLRALVGASGAASLAMAPELEIGEGKPRLAGLGDRLIEHKKQN